ncbi:hypothetical protein OP10G_0636 [Fimbriimonas ginsengisoli Gsoil 348]|uniref:Uncharacterized protein n=1 Tax=Fimbriimonas ginsengisoli Gsoil 348 TaxID=661478 RepID=A0A068NQZ6_FIMGI|nr:hypothetical protein OP10G_0636 [Fimbriimonas ginsengisoli Gsoil 348]
MKMPTDPNIATVTINVATRVSIIVMPRRVLAVLMGFRRLLNLRMSMGSCEAVRGAPRSSFP